ncbi:MAG: DUF2815 domain-containing protein [Alphaproteobacteria bacterium]|nr:MAG: DUF2815 domain-containing protein [Alphaproteobacteria bacterium]
MTTQNKNKYQKPLTTPKGIFSWPKLNRPDDKFNKENPVYSVNLILSGDGTAQLKAKLQPLFDAALEEAQEKFSAQPVPKQKKKPLTINDYFEDEYDDEGELTGNTIFKFKMNSTFTDQKTGDLVKRKPSLFDAKAKPFNPSVDIWSGTEGKVSFTTSGYFMPATGASGLSMRLKGAQIIDLVTKGTGSADSCGFGEEEGYDSTEASDGFGEETSSQSNDASTGDPEDDF